MRYCQYNFPKQMGATCCQQIDNAQMQNFNQIAYLSDYSQSSWPKDEDLQKQIKFSNIYNPSLQIVPLKHKVYNRWFWGHWVDGRPTGRGILYSRLAKDNIYYQGEFQGQPHGIGRVIFNGGQWQYNGQISRGKADGKGRLINRKQGFQYSGTWKYSKALKGILTLYNVGNAAETMIGQKVNRIGGNIQIQLQNQKQNDKCIIKYPDGKIYKGQINKSRFFPEGNGQLTFPNQNRYIGQWYDGEMHGHGRFQWQDGSFYQGQYRYGKKDGQGKFNFSSGNVYEGFWKDGRQHGRGILFDCHKNVLKKGQWREGNYQQSILRVQ